MSWGLWEVETEGRWRNAYPVLDLKPHVMGTNCWCHPVLDGGHLIIHNAMDGRELYEFGLRKVH